MATTSPNVNRQHLERVRIAGFKSIRDLSVELQPDINILIGANGAGKSNFIEAFNFVRTITSNGLKRYVVDKGGANTLLHFGRDITTSINLRFEYSKGTRKDAIRAYEVHLRPNDHDQLVIASEAFPHRTEDKHHDIADVYFFQDQFESGLAADKHRTSRHLLDILHCYRIHHFHDASPGSPPRRTARRADSHHLQGNGSNIASWLFHLKETNPESFDLIESLVRQVSPFFGAFVLRPMDSAGLHVRLEWKARDRDDYFDIAAMSDGTVRFICLACLLLQPNLPPLILVDEPELGLHPSAIAILAGMVHSASAATQLIVSTQSVTLVNHFEPCHVWCVDRMDDATVLRNLGDKDFIGWLDGYALGDIWEDNLVWEENGVMESGGHPR